VAQGGLEAPPDWEAASRNGAIRGAGPAAAAAGLALAATALAAWTWGLGPVLSGLHVSLFLLFALAASWRLLLPTISRTRAAPWRRPDPLPRYTVIVPLRDEAPMAGQIARSLQALQYPRDRLQALLVVEADDPATRDALLATGLPAFAQVLVAPPGAPATKPRACNAALAHATGDLVVVYDAEDEPDPRQLLEAAARFAAAPPSLAVLQAPLRITPRRDVLGRQFALEYAALFEVVLPALAALRLPFPLGGTSNHFRRDALAAAGGWDAYNVTEDADIGFRLAAAGFSAGMLRSPTWESAPETLDAWLPQRSRWLKGYVQTWATAMRRPWAGGWRRALALQATLGLAVLTGLLHGPLLLLALAAGGVALIDLHGTTVLAADAVLLGFAWVSTAAILMEGAARAGMRATLRDTALAIVYWPLQSLAGAYALQQLVFAPFRWDKTPHRPADAGTEPPRPPLDAPAPVRHTPARDPRPAAA
jgi:cellulose synthase/poly-beta-1,6-N-acetylglucosamine synthase-like glycosyltransferase